MIKSKIPIYLASQSPRRRDMMNMMGINFKILKVNIDEKINNSESPIKNVKRLAKEKCDSALENIKNGIIISADTIVVLGGEIIGKPKNKKDAKSILRNSWIVWPGHVDREWASPPPGERAWCHAGVSEQINQKDT